jgi:hypothetical protein
MSGRSKSLKNIIVDNCVFEILGTTPNKIFTSGDISIELDKVYGVKTSQGYLWKLLNEVLLTSELIVKKDKVGTTFVYEIVNRGGITSMLDPDVNLPVKPVDHLEEPELEFNSVDPIKVLGQEKYNMLCAKISGYGIKPVDEMVLTAAAIYEYCCSHDVTEFKTSNIFNKLRMISTNVVMTKIHTLHEKRCIISADTGFINQEIIYKLKHDPVDCDTITKNGSLVEKPKDEKVEEVESPAEKIAGVSLTTKEIGLGVIDWIHKAETEREEIMNRMLELVKENGKLLDDNFRMEEELHKLKNEFVTLSSNHDKLVKSTAGTDSEITLRSMGGDQKKRVGL